MDILGIEANADVCVNGAVIRGLDEPLEALEIDNGVVVDALEGDGGNGAAQMALLRRDDIHVLRTDDDVDRLVGGKALVHALELAAEEFDHVVLQHDAVENIGFADEVRDECVLRLVVNILRLADLLDFALVHDDDGVGHGQRFFLIVRDIYKCNPHSLLDVLQLVLHVLAQAQVERAQRLVEQQHLRAVDQRAGDGHTLLLAAGQTRHLAVFKALQADDFQHLGHALVNFVLLDLCNAQAEGDIVVHVQMREQRVALEDRVDLALIRRQIVDALAVEQHVAGRGRQKAADNPEHGRLSTAAGTQQCEEFLVVDV